MQKWAWFSMGTLSGVIVVLVFALVSQQSDASAHARGASVQGDGFTIFMTPGGSQPNIYDLVWVLHEHDPIPALKRLGDEDETGLTKPKRMSLMLYKAENQGRTMKLVSSRDISYDEELLDYNCDKPTVVELKTKLKKDVDRLKK